VQASSLILGFLLLCSLFTGHNLIKDLTKFGISLAIPAILVWAVMLFTHSKNKLGTFLAFSASGALGVLALMHPAVEGSKHSMTPLLTGLFAFPVLLATLFQRRSRKSIYLEKQPEVDAPKDLKILGFAVGLISVVLPGLGTSSLVSIGQDFTESDAEYLTMSAFAESTGEVLALVLGIMSIASRSSDAAIIQQIIEKHSGEFALNPAFAFLLLGTLVVSCWIGLKLVKVVSFPYRVMLNLIPVKLQALIVAFAMIGLVWKHTSVWGMGIMIAGTLIHLGAKGLGASNQVFFACMTVPMILSMLHINPFR
jgi:TctA family transporter